jgi:hypothetical protein
MNSTSSFGGLACASDQATAPMSSLHHPTKSADSSRINVETLSPDTLNIENIQHWAIWYFLARTLRDRLT